MPWGIGRRALLRALAAVPGVTRTAIGHRFVGEHATSPSDWPQFSHDSNNTRYNAGVSAITAPLETDWSASAPKGFWTIVLGDTVYVATSDGVRAIDVQDGRHRWTYETANRPSGLVAANGTIYITVRDTEVVAIRPDKTVRWRAAPTEALFMATPWDGDLFVTSGRGGVISRLDGSTGAVRWQASVDGTTPGPAISNGRLFASIARGPLVVLSTKSGDEVVRSNVTFEAVRSPVVAGGLVLVPSSTGVYALERRTADFQWEHRGELMGVATADDTVIAAENGTLTALALSDGSTRWSREVQDASRPLPAIADDTAIVSDGSIIRGFDIETGDQQWAVDVGDPTYLPISAGSSVYSMAQDTGLVSLSSAASSDLSVSSDGGAVRAGDTVTVAFELHNSGSKPATNPTLVIESLPEGWAVETTDPGAGEWTTDRKWTTDSLDTGATARPSVTLAVPDTSEGTYTIPSHVETRDGTTADSASATVEVTKPPSLTLEAVRPIQTVVDSHVPGVSHAPIPDPDLVATRPTSVLFKFEGERVENIDDDTEVPLTVTTDQGTEKTVNLRGKRVQELSYGPDESADAVQPERVLADVPQAERPPIFNISAGVSTIGVEVGGDTVEGDTVELSEGSDFGLVESRTFRIGLMEIYGPEDDSGNRVYGRASDGQLQKRYKLPGDDVSGIAATPYDKLQKIVKWTKRYLKRVYPVTDIEIEIYPGRLQGERPSLLGEPFTSAMHQDMEVAYDLLHEEFDDLDATAAIVPNGYFDYHGRDAGGIEFTSPFGVFQPQTAACIMDPADGDLGFTAATFAQEIGHHLEGTKAYPKPLAQRRDTNSDGTVDSKDRSHARTEAMGEWNGTVIDAKGLRSTAFDLFDGTFSVLREGGLRGFWGEGRTTVQDPPAQDRDWTLTSFMSYTFEDRWTDAHVYQRMIDDDLSPTPPVATLPGGSDSKSLSGIAATGDDETIHVGSIRESNTSPTPTRKKGAVTLEMTGPNGKTYETRTVPDQMRILGHGGANETLDGVFTFSVPYPKETESLRIRHEGQGLETTVNPVEFTLRSAIRSLPDTAFTAKPDKRRETLLSSAKTVQERMDAGDYDEATETLREMRSNVRSWVKADYGAAANQPTRKDLVALIDDALSRVKTIESVVRTETQYEVPEWVPWVGGGAASLGLGAGVYRYLRGGDGNDAGSGDEGEVTDDDAGDSDGPDDDGRDISTGSEDR